MLLLNCSTGQRYRAKIWVEVRGADTVGLWAGQSAGLSWCRDVRVLLDQLVKEVSLIGDTLQLWNAPRHQALPSGGRSEGGMGAETNTDMTAV
jgi:hypothetical protein